MSAAPGSVALVFTDLDGSLLDHHSYSYHDAEPLLRRLEGLGIPVIPATSKTRAEVERLRGELGNGHPFIVENGAAVFVPQGYFAQQPEDTELLGAYWVRALSPPRRQWLDLLQALQQEFPGEFETFHAAGTEGIARMTGLSPERAEEANRRDFSEPVHFSGDEARRRQFMARLREQGASVQQGGRFLAVTGDCDKGRALSWLRQTYVAMNGAGAVVDLAVGDSANDVAMLEAAGTALLIRSPVHDFPPLRRSAGVIYSENFGPAGWSEGVARWLDQQRLVSEAP